MMHLHMIDVLCRVIATEKLYDSLLSAGACANRNEGIPLTEIR